MAQDTHPKYENFDVRIEKVGESYFARVSAASSGEGEAIAELSGPIDQLEEFLRKVGHARRKTRGQAEMRLSEAKKFGRGIESVFRGEALNCLQTSLGNISARNVGMRIRLRLAGVPELSDIPWEFLYSDITRSFFSLSAYTPIVRYLEFPESIRPVNIVSPLRILVIIASPSNYQQLDVEQEWEKLEDTLADLTKSKLVVLRRLATPQLTTLVDVLRDEQFHILHFIGHGEFDNGGALVFEDERQRGRLVFADKLGAILHDQRSLRLVVLNACEGARADARDPFSGTAQTLVRQGIPAVLAMQFEITDEAAINFTLGFYSAVAIGDPIDTALAYARLRLFAQQDDGVEWATPVLYMRASDGRIFDLSRTPPVIELEKEIEETRLQQVALQNANRDPPKESLSDWETINHPPKQLILSNVRHILFSHRIGIFTFIFLLGVSYFLYVGYIGFNITSRIQSTDVTENNKLANVSDRRCDLSGKWGCTNSSECTISHSVGKDKYTTTSQDVNFIFSNDSDPSSWLIYGPNVSSSAITSSSDCTILYGVNGSTWSKLK